MSFRSGFVCVVGRPNVGKSTLVNALVGTKVAITSDKPQTTRSAIRGILNLRDVQIVFVDTPGYHKPRNQLGRRLNERVRSAWSDVDLCVFVVDGAGGVGAGDERVASDLRSVTAPVLCVVNKLDRMNKNKVADQLVRASRLGDFEEFVPLSARTGEQVDLLRDLIVRRMPEGPQFYPEDASSDQPPPVFVAELIREKLLSRTRDEIPHSLAVTVEEYDERDDGVLEIHALVLVERESQKGIVIGRGGEVLKEAGTEVREEIEALFGRRVYVGLKVRVEKDWQRKDWALDRLGF
jgi:GTPase